MRKGLLASAAVVALLLTGCAGNSGGSGGDGAKPTSLRLASAIANNSFDPSQLQTGNHVEYWQPVFDTLLVLDTDGQLQPNLATEWEYDESRTKLTLTLRDDVEFSDGTALDAEGVKTGLEFFRDGTGSNASMLRSVVDVAAPDATHVELTLAEPDPGLVNYLSTVAGAVASPASLTSADLATNPVGSGPYLLDTEKSVTGSKWVYTRNENYWNAEAFPYDNLSVTVMEENTARLNALRSGEIDGAILDQKSADEAEKSGLTLNVHRLDWQGLVIADRNGSKVEPLGDVRVRQAINLALDREGYTEKILSARGVASTQIFNEQSIAFDSALNKKYGYDVDKAKALLAEAGYPDGFEITMPLMSLLPAANDIVEQQLADIGITVNWDKVVTEQYIPSVQSGDYGMFFMQLSSGNEWRDVYKSLLPSGPWNPLHTEDAKVSGLVESAALAQSDDEYKSLLQELNGYVVDQAWFAPIAFTDTIYATAKGTSVKPQPQNVVPSIRNFS